MALLINKVTATDKPAHVGRLLPGYGRAEPLPPTPAPSRAKTSKSGEHEAAGLRGFYHAESDR